MRQIVLRLFIVNCENYWEQVCPSGFRPLSNKNNFFHAGAPFLYLLNTSESICFADVFREYENRTLVWNKLNPFTLHFHRMPLKCFLNSSQKNENEDSCLGMCYGNLFSFQNNSSNFFYSINQKSSKIGNTILY